MINETSMRTQTDLVVPDPDTDRFPIDIIQHYRVNTVPSLTKWTVVTGVYKQVKDIPTSLNPKHYFRRYRVQSPAGVTTHRADTTLNH